MPSNWEHTKSLWQNLRNKNVFLACSGGVDSIVLLHLLKSLNVNLTVIHVNYQLRGEDSDHDAKLVETRCQELKIPFQIRVVDLKKALESGGNLQDEARKVRYTWFNEILAKNKRNTIALAHHQDDQVETFLMNLARKSGVLGLACMKQEHQGIVRPLLYFSKAEILKYASNHFIQWREDQSNKSNNYTRNRLRNEFIPLLKTQFTHFNQSVLLLVEAFQRKQAELEQVISPITESILETASLSTSTFSSLDEFEQVELLHQLEIPVSYLPRLSELKERGKRIEIKHLTYEAVVRDEHQFTFLKNAQYSFELSVTEINSLPNKFDKNHVYFDVSKLEGELQIRTWQIGDRISPLGMSGSQLVSDIIKDAKITANAKRTQLVVHDDKSVLWCVGLKIGRTAIANSTSEKILRCSVIDSTKEELEDQ